ncbi:SDR family oxidoreductase [Dactylosporangium sp. NPDC048998]|uniref:SDR family oxidoreductase n=1 Tax=Dactylosporangium sp. NPDC048998 TaxID=3363976 RepID=UPI00371134CB
MSTAILGCGLIGAAVRARLAGAGHPVWTVSRSAGPDPGAAATHLRHDLSVPAERAALRDELCRRAPRCIVLTHGPSDVSWIEDHPEAAGEVHVGVAETLAALGATTRAQLLMVSTDNVFSGRQGHRRPSDRIEPHNAYGRIKARAERVVLAAGGRVLRVSLVYGDAGPAHRATYAQRCLTAATAGEAFRAPVDQSFTPVHVDDVANVVAAIAQTHAASAGVEHLAGPQELSRYDFARLAYTVAGADPNLVRPCLRRDTTWASRPRYSSLSSSDFSALVPGAWPPATPTEGLRRMVGA